MKLIYEIVTESDEMRDRGVEQEIKICYLSYFRKFVNLKISIILYFVEIE